VIQSLPHILTIENGTKLLLPLLMEQLPSWGKQLQQEFFKSFQNRTVLTSISFIDKEMLLFKVIHMIKTTDELYFKKVINHHSNRFLVCPWMDRNDVGVI
jgi:hypothetical protein